MPNDLDFTVHVREKSAHAINVKKVRDKYFFSLYLHDKEGYRTYSKELNEWEVSNSINELHPLHPIASSGDPWESSTPHLHLKFSGTPASLRRILNEKLTSRALGAEPMFSGETIDKIINLYKKHPTGTHTISFDPDYPQHGKFPTPYEKRHCEIESGNSCKWNLTSQKWQLISGNPIKYPSDHIRYTSDSDPFWFGVGVAVVSLVGLFRYCRSKPHLVEEQKEAAVAQVQKSKAGKKR